MTPGQYWQGGFGAYLEQGYARNMQRSRRHLPRMRFRLMYARSAWPGDTATGAATASGRRASGCPSRRARRAPPPTRFCTCSRALNDTRAAALTIVIVLRLTQLQERAARRAGRHGPPGRAGGGDAGQGARGRQAQQALVLLTLFSVAISLFSGQLSTAVWCGPFGPVAPSHPRSFLSAFLYTTVCKRFTRGGDGGALELGMLRPCLPLIPGCAEMEAPQLDNVFLVDDADALGVWPPEHGSDRCRLQSRSL